MKSHPAFRLEGRSKHFQSFWELERPSRMRPLDLPSVCEVAPGELSGQIIYVDGFGNLVTNVPTGSLPEILSLTLGLRLVDRAITRLKIIQARMSFTA